MTQLMLFTRPERSLSLINFLRGKLETKKKKTEGWETNIFTHTIDCRLVNEFKFWRNGDPWISCVTYENRPNVIITNTSLTFNVLEKILQSYKENVLIEVVG